MKSFASDNNAGIHDQVMQAIRDANQGDAIAYGDDPHTRETERMFREIFGQDTLVFPVFNGTAANVTAIAHLLKPYQSVLCSASSHMQQDECGAPEKNAGVKLQVVQTPNGKIHPRQLEFFLHSVGFQHHVQPGMVSITQATELGTVYTPAEIMELSRFARENDMLLHMDGARIANAIAALEVSAYEMVVETGIDILSFGGTKNGMMLGEAVVFLDAELGKAYEYTRKQHMQLASKMRFISAQFNALLSNGLWLENARQANRMAQKLRKALVDVPGIELTQKVQTNAVFAILPEKAIKHLMQSYFFYVWDESRHEVRWMTSFNTTEKDITDFVSAVKASLAAC